MRKIRTPDLAAYEPAGYTLIILNRWDYVDGLGRERGKSPLHNDWPRREYEPGRALVATEDGYNVGVRLQASQVVLDFDPRNDPESLGWAALVTCVGQKFLDSCPRVNTGSGGDHFYATKPADLRIRERIPSMPGVEFKTVGRQVVSAGSIHPNGTFYEWDDFSPPLADAPELPDVLLSLIGRPGAGDLHQGEPGEINCEQLAKLLTCLDPCDFKDHNAWLEVGMASYHATNGLGIAEFVAWSTSDDDFVGHGSLIQERWPTWKSEPEEAAVTIATLLKYVREAGGHVGWLAVAKFPDDLPEIPEPELGIPPGPLAPLERLNQKFCVVPEGSGTYVYRMDEGAPQRMMPNAFFTLLSNQYIENDKGNLVKIAPVWMGSSRRRTYKGVEFAPEGGREGYLNTWTGWAIEPADRPWDLLHELIVQVLADKDKDSASYILDWCAHMLQHPARPAEVALVIKGPKGTGKSTFGRVLYEVAGRHGFALAHGLAKQFNAHLREMVFLLADEAFFAGDHKTESQLKSMITEPVLMYEPKGVDASMARNCLHIVMCSNADWVVPASMEDERRFAVFEIQQQRDREWWDSLHLQLDNGGREGFVKHLLEREIGDWHPRTCIPRTSALVRQKLASLSPVDMWWYGLLRRGHLPAELPDGGGDPGTWQGGAIMVSRRTMQDSLKADLGRGPGTKRRVEILLGRRLRELVPGLANTARERRGHGGMDGGTYRIASLAECRERFEALVGGEIDWEE